MPRQCWRGALDVRDGGTNHRLGQGIEHDPYLVAHPDAIDACFGQRERHPNVGAIHEVEHRAPGLHDIPRLRRARLHLGIARRSQRRVSESGLNASNGRLGGLHARIRTLRVEPGRDDRHACSSQLRIGRRGDAATRRASARRSSSSSAGPAPSPSIVTALDSR